MPHYSKWPTFITSIKIDLCQAHADGKHSLQIGGAAPIAWVRCDAGQKKSAVLGSGLILTCFGGSSEISGTTFRGPKLLACLEDFSASVVSENLRESSASSYSFRDPQRRSELVKPADLSLSISCFRHIQEIFQSLQHVRTSSPVRYWLT